MISPPEDAAIPGDRKIFIYPYRLRARHGLNVISRRSHFEGVLIRTSGGGYGCIHPWPELGDPPLEKCLADLAGRRFRPIVRRALRCAEYDAAGREFGHSLFEEMEVPESHATLVRPDFRDLETAAVAGFSVVKLKAGKKPPAEIAFLREAIGKFPQFRWRLDFNEALSPEAAAAFLAEISPEQRRAIDFVEDPCPYHEPAWIELQRKSGVAIAVDREAAPARTAARFLVLKPAIDEPFFLAEAALAASQRVIVTSYMDHPLGQTFAAWEAARLGLQFPGITGICGLQTHHLYEPDEFSELLGAWQPQFQPPPGHGLGFDDLLDALPWAAL